MAISPGALAVSPEWAGKWRADLTFLADTLPKVHSNLFHTLPRDSFRAEIERLSGRVAELDHADITVELARIIARVGDGHTRLTLPFDTTAGFFTGHTTTAPPLVPGLVFHHLPVRLRFFSDGLFVVRTDRAHRELLGGRVVGIGTRSLEQAIAAMEPTVQRDNQQQVRNLLPIHLVVPEILRARGVIEDAGRVRLVVVGADGRKREAELTAVAPGAATEWLEARDAGDLPLVDRQPERRHWFQRVAGTSVLYARYRAVVDDSDQTVAEFSDRLFEALGQDGADRLVLDLRGNVGGNGFLNRPLMRGILSSPTLRKPGTLFVLADRGTFSAAMMLLTDLEKLSPAIIVGEESGARPNGYGDSRRVRLPGSGLTVRASTLYWQMSDPRDTRDGIEPHVAVEPRFAQWQARRDPVLDTTLVLARDGPDPSGTWNGVVSQGYQRIPMSVTLTRTERVWTARITASSLGARDLAADSVDVSGRQVVFTLSGPGSVWEFRGHLASGAIVGIVRYQGSDLAFVLNRAP